MELGGFGGDESTELHIIIKIGAFVVPMNKKNLFHLSKYLYNPHSNGSLKMA